MSARNAALQQDPFLSQIPRTSNVCDSMGPKRRDEGAHTARLQEYKDRCSKRTGEGDTKAHGAPYSRICL